MSVDLYICESTDGVERPVLVTLVPVRALSGTNFLSVRELTENKNNSQKMKISFFAIKKGHT